MANVKRFKESSVPKQDQEMARIKVIQGPDYGTTWVLFAPSASIGRGDENNVKITDLKASRVHAKIHHDGSTWKISDEKSANGTLLNGEVLETSLLNSGDTFALGESVFEFVLSQSGTRLLTAPPRKMSDLKDEKKSIEKHQARLRAITTVGGLSSPKPAATPSAATNPENKRKMIIYGLLAVGMYFLLFVEDESPVKKVEKKQKQDKRSLATFLPTKGNKEINVTANRFFKTGFREFRERNYLRAKMKFETALQVDPNHFLARLYLEKSDQEIENEVQFHLDRGRKSQHAGKLISAKGHYEAILRLLYRDKTNPSFIQANDELKELEKILKDSG